MSFVFATWNVLATPYIRLAKYPHTPARCLDPSWRHAAIVARASGLAADVLCLQEVDRDVFALLAASLEPLGYVAHHALKVGKPEGCATFVRAERARVVESRRVVFGDTSGHVALVVVIEHEGERVAIVNTHFKWDPPETPHDRNRSVSQAGEVIAEVIALLDQTTNASQIVCGDLNVTPESMTIQNFVRARFVDAFAGEPACTANPHEKAKRIDYVFLRGPLTVRTKPPTRVVDDTPLPSNDEPSDHVPLVVTIT